MVPGVLEIPPVPVTELLGSLLGLFRVGGHWRGTDAGVGASEGLSSLRLYWVYCQFSTNR
jgi:hypothetical protein